MESEMPKRSDAMSITFGRLYGRIPSPPTDATARQKLIITRLCMALGITEPLEEQPMTTGQAGELVRKMQSEIRLRRER